MVLTIYKKGRLLTSGPFDDLRLLLHPWDVPNDDSSDGKLLIVSLERDTWKEKENDEIPKEREEMIIQDDRHEKKSSGGDEVANDRDEWHPVLYPG